MPDRVADNDNGTQVRMKNQHPHRGKTGIIRQQPDDTPAGRLGMYLIEFDGPHEGNAYALPEEWEAI